MELQEYERALDGLRETLHGVQLEELMAAVSAIAIAL